MKIYVITDTHFGHKKIIEYCYRPLDYEKIIFKHLYKLETGSILIHLGDICIGKDEEHHKNYIQTLPHLRKILVKGNHDHKSNTWYLQHGWDFVCRQYKDKLFGKRILFSHIPQKDDEWYDLNIHGHFHNTNHRKEEPELNSILNDKQKLIALEHTNYQPILLKTLIEKL